MFGKARNIFPLHSVTRSGHEFRVKCCTILMIQWENRTEIQFVQTVAGILVHIVHCYRIQRHGKQ